MNIARWPIWNVPERWGVNYLFLFGLQLAAFTGLVA